MVRGDLKQKPNKAPLQGNHVVTVSGDFLTVLYIFFFLHLITTYIPASSRLLLKKRKTFYLNSVTMFENKKKKNLIVNVNISLKKA